MQLVVLYPINLSQVYKKADEHQFIKSIEVMQLDPPICWATMF